MNNTWQDAPTDSYYEPPEQVEATYCTECVYCKDCYDFYWCGRLQKDARADLGSNPTDEEILKTFLMAEKDEEDLSCEDFIEYEGK